MIELYLIFENFTNGLSSLMLDAISLSSITCGILVIISKNPVVSVLFLIGLFISMSAYLIMLGLTFIGLSYLLVYVGAVSILFLFILMLINVRISELVTNNNNSFFLANIIGVVFIFILHGLLPNSYSKDTLVYVTDITTIIKKMYENNIFKLLSNDILQVTSQIWDSTLADNSHISSIGNIIYTAYPLWLILISLILLLAMVGAIVITIKQK